MHLKADIFESIPHICDVLQFCCLLSSTQALKAEGYVGAVFTQLTDVEAELNGYFSYDREVVKVDLQALAKMHAELIG